jgi:uncharacterized membrane protein YccC
LPERHYPWLHFPRVAVAIAVPLACSLALPHPEIWGLLPFGVLPVALADRGGTRAGRAERCLASLCAAAAGALVGGYVGGRPLLTAAALVVLALVSGGVSWLGPLASVAALDLLVFACISSGGSLGAPAWRPPLLILAGGAWTLAILLTGRVRADAPWHHPPPDARRIAAAALRLGLCVAVAEGVANLRGVERGYWIPLTVAIVLRPEFGDVVVRSVGRAVGTLVGASAAAGVLALMGTGWGVVPIVALLAASLPFAVRRHFVLLATGISAVVVLLVASVVGHGTSIAVARIVDTTIGCGIVLVVGYALWLRLARAMPRRAPTAADPA